MSENNDRLYNCIVTYEKLQKDVTFNFELGDRNVGIKNVSLRFPEESFRHFIGISEDHLGDKDIYTKKTKPREFYQNVRDKKIKESDISQSVDFNKPTDGSENQVTGVHYFLTDRWNAISNLYDYFHNSNESNIEIYSWARDTVRIRKDENGNERKTSTSPQRPNNSKIDADLMIVFSDTVDKKNDKEKVYMFFRCDNRNPDNGIYFVPVSGFASNLDFTQISNSLPLHRYEILSMTEEEKKTAIKNQLITAPLERTNHYQTILAKKIAAQQSSQQNQNKNQIDLDIFNSVTQPLSDLKKVRDALLTDLTKRKNLGKDPKTLPSWNNYIAKKNEIVNLLKQATEDWKNNYFQRLGDALRSSKDEKKELIENELKDFDSTGEYKQKYMSFSNNISIDASGTATIAPVVALSMADHWKNFKDYLQQMPKNFIDNLKLTFQSLGNDIKNLGKGVSKQISRVTNSLTSSDKSDRIADRTAELMDTKTLYSTQNKMERSNKKNIKHNIVEEGNQRKNERENSREKNPKQHNPKRDGIE